MSLELAQPLRQARRAWATQPEACRTGSDHRTEACTMGSDHGDQTYRPPLRAHLDRPPPAATVPPGLRELRADAPGSASPEMSRTAGQTVHATFRSWDRRPSKRAGYRAPGRTSSCKARCHHGSRTCCSGTWPFPSLRSETEPVADRSSREIVRAGPGRIQYQVPGSVYVPEQR
jgi:hypothetical protein